MMSATSRDRVCLAVLGVVMALTLLLAAPKTLSAADVFLRGDANADGTVSFSDGLMIRRFLFNSDPPPPCLDAADADNNGKVEFTDTILVLIQFFPNDPGGGWLNRIAEPYPEPGPDRTPDIGAFPPGPSPDELGCESYDIQPPEETDDVVRLGDVFAAPGQKVEVPIYLTNSVDVEAIQIVVKYDPGVFTPAREANYEGSFYESIISDGSGIQWFSALQSWPELGIFTVGIIGSLIHTGSELPPGTMQLVAKIPGTISPSARPGSTSILEPTSEPSGPFGMRTELTHRAQARYASLIPATVAATLNIVPDISIFRRGDSNGDGTLDISDPQATLTYLFLGGEPLECLDAADANDDGRLDIADPITTLQVLFVREGAQLPPPSGKPAGDPTADTLDCHWSRGL